MAVNTRAGRAAAGKRADGVRPPEQGWIVPLSDVRVDDEIERAALEAVRSGWWSMGPRVGELERDFAAFCGVKHAFAVANGTAALHLALLAVGCGPGDDVVVPSLNFVAAANTICHAGAAPVFCDVTAVDDLNLDPRDAAQAIGPATRALVVMHYGGHPCRMDEILELARARGIAIVEDAAHAPGATWQGRKCGTFGDVGCFSFFSNKNLPMGEGGMVVTDDDALAEKIRLLRSHGMTTLTWDRHRGHAHSYDVVAHGYNYRLDEIRAAIGCVQLSRLAEENAKRARHVALYRAALDGASGIVMPFAPRPETDAAHHLAVIVLPEGCGRDEMRSSLAAAGVQTSVHYPPIHEFTAYRGLETKRPLPVTEAVASRLLTLPLYPHMSEADVSTVAAAVLAAT
jgi:dTDP-4-amino-4,6-dideoxygalactose transaminase